MSYTHRSQFHQRIILGFHGTHIDDPLLGSLCDALQSGLIGGLIFFERNIRSEASCQQLIKDFQSLSPHPLWIGIDMEGGLVNRFKSRPYSSPEDVG